MLKHMLRVLALPLLCALTCFMVPAQAQEQLPQENPAFEDYLFPGLPNYYIQGQSRIVAPMTLFVQSTPGEGIPTELTVTGNCVDSFYTYAREDQNHRNRIEVASHYEKAIRKYEGKILFKDEYNFHGSFVMDGKQFYIVVQVYSKGAEYEVIIVEALM